jgi:hypothetical protein
VYQDVLPLIFDRKLDATLDRLHVGAKVALAECEGLLEERKAIEVQKIEYLDW